MAERKDPYERSVDQKAKVVTPPNVKIRNFAPIQIQLGNKKIYFFYNF